MNLGRSCVAAFFVGFLSLGHLVAEEALRYDAEELLARYAAHKDGPIPCISEMNWGIPVLLVYGDGTVIFPHPDGKKVPRERATTASGYMEARLSEGELAALFRGIDAIAGFKDLEANYKLTEWSDQALHTIRVTPPGRPEKTVVVYGELDPGRRNNLGSRFPQLEPPRAFLEVDTLLRNFRPQNARPWNPGFVEVTMSDYSYAPDQSLIWPAGWPDLQSPLVRPVGGGRVIKYLMVFPSENIVELQSFLGRRATRGAIQIGESKLSLGVRWPFPGERKWSTWNF